jgi:hypothetical protein
MYEEADTSNIPLKLRFVIFHITKKKKIASGLLHYMHKSFTYWYILVDTWYKWYSSGQCWAYRMFYPGSGSDHFLIPDSDPNIFSCRILHEKMYANLLFSCSLCFQEQSLSLSQSQKDLGSRKNSSWIRISNPEGKKAPDPGSATLIHGKGGHWAHWAGHYNF